MRHYRPEGLRAPDGDWNGLIRAEACLLERDETGGSRGEGSLREEYSDRPVLPGGPLRGRFYPVITWPSP